MISSPKAGLSLRVIVACLVFISFIIEESPKAAAPAQVRLAPCLTNDPLTVFRNTIKSSLLHNHDLRKLVQQAKEHKLKGKIYLAEYKNHSKILICDDEYVVCGSFNWLSNAAGQNIERSYIIYDKKLVLKEAQIIKKFIKDNS